MTLSDIIVKLDNALTAEVEAILVYTGIHMAAEEASLKLLALELSIEEMRHVDIIGKMIIDLEGCPELKPRKVRLLYAEDKNMLEHIEKLEEEAIDMYKSMIDEIDNEDITNKLKRILEDEEEHLVETEETEEELEENEE